MAFRKLEIRLLNYFMLIAIAAIMIGIEFYFEMTRPGLSETIYNAAPADIVHDVDGKSLDSNPLTHLRNKIVVMFGLLTVVVAIVMMMFIKNITAPLCHMAEVAEHINHGDLSQVVEVENDDEIGELGIAINEVTSNLQEVASFTTMTSGSAIEQLEDIISAVQRGDCPDAETLQSVKSDIESLSEFVSSFELLQTDLSS